MEIKTYSECDYDDLNEEEKELVQSGEYEPWDFEYSEDHDDLDEDDYYSEDDIK